MNSVGTTCFSSKTGEASVGAGPLPVMFSSGVELSVTLSLALTYATDPGVSMMVGSAKR